MTLKRWTLVARWVRDDSTKLKGKTRPVDRQFWTKRGAREMGRRLDTLGMPWRHEVQRVR